MASNIGGTATLIGDPPNIIIAGETGLSFPIATKGRVHATVTRSDFFRHLVERFGAIAAEALEDSDRPETDP